MSAANTTMVDRVAEFLDVDPGVVVDLHEHAELLPTLLAQIGLELRAQRGASATRAAQPDLAAAVLRAVAGAWGGQVFQFGALLRWAEEMPLPGRKALLVAARAFVGGAPDEDLSAKRLAARLERYEGRPCAGYTLLRAGRRNGSAVWRVAVNGDVGDLVP